MKFFLTMSLIEAHKTRWEWKTILNVPLNETHKTTWRELMKIYAPIPDCDISTGFNNDAKIQILNSPKYRRSSCAPKKSVASSDAVHV